jgi:hypothetical protein
MSNEKAKRYRNRLKVEVMRSEKTTNENTRLMIQIALLREALQLQLAHQSLIGKVPPIEYREMYREAMAKSNEAMTLSDKNAPLWMSHITDYLNLGISWAKYALSCPEKEEQKAAYQQRVSETRGRRLRWVANNLLKTVKAEGEQPGGENGGV